MARAITPSGGTEGSGDLCIGGADFAGCAPGAAEAVDRPVLQMQPSIGQHGDLGGHRQPLRSSEQAEKDCVLMGAETARRPAASLRGAWLPPAPPPPGARGPCVLRAADSRQAAE